MQKQFVDNYFLKQIKFRTPYCYSVRNKKHLLFTSLEKLTLSPPCGRLSCAGHINAANNYREFGTGASFWSATESERDNTLAHFRYLFYIRAEMYGDTYGMGYGFSVRCVHD